MVMNRKGSSRTISLPVGIVIGTGCAALIAVLGAMVLAWMIMEERVGEDSIEVGCMVIVVLAAVVGSICAWGAVRQQRLLVTGLTIAAFYILLLAMALPFGGQYHGVGRTALLVVLGGGIALIPAAVGGGSGAQGHKNRRIVKLHKNLARGK